MYYQWIVMLKTDFKSFAAKGCYICLLCICLPAGISHAFSLADVASPPDSNTTYVGNMVHNGLPLEILQFTSSQSVAELLAFYKQRWSDVSKRKDSAPAYIEKHVGGWSILSKIEASKNVVLQVKSASGGTAEGFISVSDFSESKAPEQWVEEFPRMHGSELISNTASEEKGRQAYTLIFVNDHSVSENNEFYRVSMDGYGWRYSRGGVKDNVSMLHFLNDDWYCDIALSEADDGKSVILANLVEMNERK
jgi:hypothetical protein